MTINRKLMKRFQEQALRTLSGEWVIIGGAVLHVLGLDKRLTMDIDLARKSGDLDETLKLMKIAEKLNLPVTAINQAGAFFLRRIQNWEKKLILCAESSSCRIYRPHGELYLQLKMSRMSESDLEDCMQMIQYCKDKSETLNCDFLRQEIKKTMKKLKSNSAILRLQTLMNALR